MTCPLCNRIEDGGTGPDRCGCSYEDLAAALRERCTYAEELRCALVDLLAWQTSAPADIRHRAVRLAEPLKKSTPDYSNYNAPFCHHPEKCGPVGRCLREIACND